MVALKVLLISKEFHYPAMLASLMLLVEWMVDSLALNLLLGSSLVKEKVNCYVLGLRRALKSEPLMSMVCQLEIRLEKLRLTELGCHAS